LFAATVFAGCSSTPRGPLPQPATATTTAPAPAVDLRERVVRNFNAAFNAQDAAAMAALVTSDVQWVSVKGLAVNLDTSTREELRRSMASYFKACPSCRSRLASVTVAKSRVSVLEVATWATSTGPREAQGFVFYEFSGQLISRVYYFAVEG
jgi:uncharacterized protein (TIGR02246 family)